MLGLRGEESGRGGVKGIGFKKVCYVLWGEIESQRNNKFVFLGPRKFLHFHSDFVVDR